MLFIFFRRFLNKHGLIGMFGDTPVNGVQKIGFLLLPNYSMIAFSSALDALCQANDLTGRPLYEPVILSTDGEPVRASNGKAQLVDKAIWDVSTIPMIVVCASELPQRAASRSILVWLQRQARHGAVVGGIVTGSHVLARAGLLDGYRATIHWEELDSFAETFPDVDAVQDIFVIDRNRFTAAAATASLDMMLHLIRLQHGPELATHVADEFTYPGMREARSPQRQTIAQRMAIRSLKLSQAISLMADNLEDTVVTAAIAHQVGLSTRGLERLFRKWLNTTPARYHRQLRLERARTLVQQTNLPMLEVAVRCGFGSAAHFSQSYSGFFGHPPSADRGFTRIDG